MSSRMYCLGLEMLESRSMLSALGLFQDSGQRLGGNTWSIALGDLDGDGDLDIFVGCHKHSRAANTCDENTVWLNDGGGQFSLGWAHAGTRVSAVALSDLDGDGDLDAFLGRGYALAGFPNEVWLNDGEGRFSDTGQRLSRGGTGDVDLADIDGDGDVDAVESNFSSSSRVWLNDGSGVFSDGQRIGTGNYFSASLGDIDGDGDLDAFFGGGGHIETADRSDRVYVNDGKGNFADSGQRLGNGWANAVQLGDLDGDGDLDAFVAGGNHQAGSGQPNEVWLNDGSGNFVDSGQKLGRSFSRWAELIDIDDDGDLDAFVANGNPTCCPQNAGQPNKVWLNDGAGRFSDSGESIPRANTVGLALGDLDDDGDFDAVFAQIQQDNEVWMNIQPVIGDANGDGSFDQLDIVRILQAGKYNTGETADFTQGDWNGDGLFNQLDIVAALQTGAYLAGE